MPGPEARPAVAIVDIDGTLCDVRAIRSLVEAPAGEAPFRRDFHAFHSASLDCPSHPAVVELVARLRDAGLLTIIVSGREERWAFLTAIWLDEHHVIYDHMALRPNGDYRPDSDIKQEIARELVRRYLPIVAIDDRDDVIDVWHSFGIPTVKVLSDGHLASVEIPTGSELPEHIASHLIQP